MCCPKTLRNQTLTLQVMADYLLTELQPLRKVTFLDRESNSGRSNDSAESLPLANQGDIWVLIVEQHLFFWQKLTQDMQGSGRDFKSENENSAVQQRTLTCLCSCSIFKLPLLFSFIIHWRRISLMYQSTITQTVSALQTRKLQGFDVL